MTAVEDICDPEDPPGTNTPEGQERALRMMQEGHPATRRDRLMWNVVQLTTATQYLGVGHWECLHPEDLWELAEMVESAITALADVRAAIVAQQWAVVNGTTADAEAGR